ncbi:HVA22/DP1t-related protein [Pseudoloma neurophilia]|uniref:Protein YOP1 n=1 Tax=Pseudoloma neurophilia TaxID=146866 RepID=A0A0R0M327_9MICR|nr:HVA22/DP1t-related protein [Pseudoloma neurophilia]
MISTILLNIVTPLAVLYNCYGYYKDKKNRHFKYFFIIMCLFLSIDLSMGFIIKFIPFIQFLKLIFVIWLALPLFNGPSFIYNFYMKKVFVHFEDDIDIQLEKTRKLFVDAIVNRLNQAYGKYKEMNKNLLTTNQKEGEIVTPTDKINQMIEEKVSVTPPDLSSVKQGFNRMYDENKNLNQQISTEDHLSNEGSNDKIIGE